MLPVAEGVAQISSSEVEAWNQNLGQNDSQ